MVHSLAMNNPQEQFHIWLLQSGISVTELNDMEEYCNLHCAAFTPVQMDDAMFQDAPVTKQYPREMYYRLLAAQLLPDDLERILYLDSDILVLNPLRPIWETDLKGAGFAAASHSWEADTMGDVNRIRLDMKNDYYNTGIILMDLERLRQSVAPEDIFSYIRKNGRSLLLPDQDVFNALYGEATLQLDDRLWNYDVRHFKTYRLKSEGVCDMD